MQCQHQPCSCLAPDGHYCSPICQERGNEPMTEGHMCECGHTDCAGTVLRDASR